MMDQGAATETIESDYKSLYKLGGTAALIAAGLTLGEVIFFVFYPLPGTVSGWFILFQSNKIIGLLDFWGLEVLMYMMFTILFLALYVALRKVNETGMAIALTFALLGIAIFFATNNPFTMLSLSDQYAAATTEVERATLLAAGQAILVNTNQRAIGGFNMGLFLVSIAGLVVSAIMLQSTSFSRLTAWAGILAHALSLADYLRQALTPSVTIALVVILGIVLFLVLWLILVGRRFHALERSESKVLIKQTMTI